MTEDIKATRLSKAAHEFNVGISTIVEFLHRKGFDLDSNPNTKLPHEAYILLLKEYSSDLNVKKESEKLILKDLHRKKESVSIDDVPDDSKSEDQDSEDEIYVKDTSLAPKTIDIKTEIKKPDIKLIGKIDLDKTLKPKTAKPEAPKAEEEKKVKKEVPAKEEPEKKKPSAEKAKESEPETVKDEKAKSPIDIHIVGKIDLETVASEAKAPKKEEKEKPKQKPAEREDAQKEEQKVPAKKIKEPADEEVKEPVIPESIADTVAVPEISVEKEEEPVELFKTPFTKLSGLTVVGKIDLPVEEKKKPVSYQHVNIDGESDFRRKKRRKRISKDKEQVPVVKPAVTDKKDKPGKRIIKKRSVRAEVDEEEVQKQIKETLARLTTKGKSKGSRYRREKREAISLKHREDEDRIEQEKNILKVTEFVSVNELATMMNTPVTDAEPAAPQAFGGRRLQRDRRQPGRRGAVRTRARGLHRGARGPPRTARRGRRRDGALGRDRRAVSRGAGQAPALRPGEAAHGRGRDAAAGHRRPDHRGQQPQARPRGGDGPLPRGPLPQVERREDRRAAAARPARRHPAPGRPFPRHVRDALSPARAPPGPRCRGGHPRAPVAGQRARAAELHPPGGDPLRAPGAQRRGAVSRRRRVRRRGPGRGPLHAAVVGQAPRGHRSADHRRAGRTGSSSPAARTVARRRCRTRGDRRRRRCGAARGGSARSAPEHLPPPAPKGDGRRRGGPRRAPRGLGGRAGRAPRPAA